MDDEATSIDFDHCKESLHPPAPPRMPAIGSGCRCRRFKAVYGSKPQFTTKKEDMRFLGQLIIVLLAGRVFWLGEAAMAHYWQVGLPLMTISIVFVWLTRPK